jgi:hypothetical protein
MNRKRIIHEINARTYWSVNWRKAGNEQSDPGKRGGYHKAGHDKGLPGTGKGKNQIRLILQVHDELIIQTIRMNWKGEKLLEEKWRTR